MKVISTENPMEAYEIGKFLNDYGFKYKRELTHYTFDESKLVDKYTIYTFYIELGD
jgi:hypothetical protein